jgi:site-specific DNA-cytosine methylase
MNVLIACEESQAVTIELRKLGIKAYSCDIQPCSGGHPEWHLQQNVSPLLGKKWDMIIAFPPCTHLCVSGARWFDQKRKDGRQQKAIDFFMQFVDAKCEHIAIENPIGIMSTIYRRPDQIIKPFMFGDNSTKSTCLWIKGLPNLKPTNIIKPTKYKTKNGKFYDEWWYKTCLISNLEERSKIRSKTFIGIAKAMANQWGNYMKRCNNGHNEE